MYHQVQEIFCTKEKRKSKVVKLNRIMNKKYLCDGAATFSVDTEQTWQGVQSNGKFVRTSCSNSLRGRGRGAPRRRNKGLRGMEHHVSKGGGSFGARDVVPLREGIRACGR